MYMQLSSKMTVMTAFVYMERLRVLKRPVLLKKPLVCIKELNIKIMENSKSPLALGVYV